MSLFLFVLPNVCLSVEPILKRTYPRGNLRVKGTAAKTITVLNHVRRLLVCCIHDIDASREVCKEIRSIVKPVRVALQMTQEEKKSHH